MFALFVFSGSLPALQEGPVERSLVLLGVPRLGELPVWYRASLPSQNPKAVSFLSFSVPTPQVSEPSLWSPCGIPVWRNPLGSKPRGHAFLQPCCSLIYYCPSTAAMGCGQCKTCGHTELGNACPSAGLGSLRHYVVGERWGTWWGGVVVSSPPITRLLQLWRISLVKAWLLWQLEPENCADDRDLRLCLKWIWFSVFSVEVQKWLGWWLLLMLSLYKLPDVYKVFIMCLKLS